MIDTEETKQTQETKQDAATNTLDALKSIMQETIQETIQNTVKDAVKDTVKTTVRNTVKELMREMIKEVMYETMNETLPLAAKPEAIYQDDVTPELNKQEANAADNGQKSIKEKLLDNDPIDRYLTIPEAAEALECNRSNVSMLCRKGKIEGATKIGIDWAIPPESIREIVRQRDLKKRYEADSDYISVREAAEILELGVQRVIKIAQDGKFQDAVCILHVWFIPKGSVKEYKIYHDNKKAQNNTTEEPTTN